jgi:hypothetical protein
LVLWKYVNANHMKTEYLFKVGCNKSQPSSILFSEPGSREVGRLHGGKKSGSGRALFTWGS